MSELQHLETFLADKAKSLVDRFAVGAMLFAVYSRARVGDLAAVQCVSIDVCQSGGAYKGYIEARSLSHKMKISSSGLGLNLPLVAPIDGVGSRQWGIDFWEVSIEAGLPLNALQPGSPMFPAPGVTGEWTTRPITPTEVKKWLHLILAELPSFDPTDLTAHGLKSTTLAMMARYGLSPTTRLILGHHSMKGLSSLETYARDAQASPLREYESMMGSHTRWYLCSGRNKIWPHGIKTSYGRYFQDVFRVQRESWLAAVQICRRWCRTMKIQVWKMILKMWSLMDLMKELQIRLSLPLRQVILQQMMSQSSATAPVQMTSLSGRLDAKTFNTSGQRPFMQNLMVVGLLFCVDESCQLTTWSSREMYFPESGFASNVTKANQSEPWMAWQMLLIGLSKG